MENVIQHQLMVLKKKKKYIALSLHPGIGETTINAQGNRMFVNEGRDGEWIDISEEFYDEMVKKYDSRS